MISLGGISMIKRKKMFIAKFILCMMLFSTIIPNYKAYASENINYKKALKDAVIFYDANKCGKDVCNNNEFDFRKECHVNDGSSVSLDLSGGYHDAGDHVKFGLPQGYAASVMGYALYEFSDGFKKTGNTSKQLEQLKYFTDYFLRCHTEKDVFYYQVGDGNIDHSYWGAPENQTRDTYLKRADSSNAASDVLGESAAALSLMYLNYKEVDINYSNKCLENAKELYNMGKTNQGLSDSQGFYSSSHYNDDLAWGAIWLYKATNDKNYLKEAEEFLFMDNPYIETTWTMCWNDMKLPATIELWKLTKDEKYKKAIDYNMNYWKNDIQTTPGGLKCLTTYGSLRYAAAESMLALVVYKETKDESLMSLSQSQIDYILGENPLNMSYMIGFGDNYPKHPHHRAANGYNSNEKYKEAKNVLTGALVGGPNMDDSFTDNVERYDFTEVAIDYNAGLVGALAGIIDLECESVVMGDLNKDNVINSMDLLLLKKYMSGVIEEIDTEAADVNMDGKINILDLVMLKSLV